MKWPTIRLGDVCRVVPGFAFKSQDWTTSGIPVVKIKNIREDNTVDLSATDHVPVEILTLRLSKFVLKNDDILLAMTGATAGKVGRVRTNRPVLLNQRVAKIAPEKADPRFIWSVVSSNRYQELFFRLADGAAQPNMSGGQIEGLEVPNPPIEVQRRVGAILSAYDDLIDNNTRRIAILEEMARRIYVEWLVSFRFPGHEGVRMVESEMGLVPEGWRGAVLGDVAAYINRGLAPRYADDAACIVINQKCIRDQRLSLGEARKQDKPVPADKVVRLGDVLINSTGVGTLGRVAQVLEAIDNCTVDTHVSIVRPGKDCDPDYFGLTLISQQAHFEAQGVGSTGQTELSRGRIAETSIVVPPLAMQRSFANIVRPMRRLTVALQNKNHNLRTTRNLLLPKLISGELDVSAMPAPEALAA